MTLRERIPTLSLKESLILELLLEKPEHERYGLELVDTSGGQLKRGTVYVTLNRMEDKGFIQSCLEERARKTPGLPRRLYRVTGYGQKVFDAWQMAKTARDHFYRAAEGTA